MSKRVLLVLVLALGVLPFIPGIAFAHHAEVSANIQCDELVHWTATAWAGQGSGQDLINSRTNSDIRVWYTQNGTVHEVTHGAFNQGNGFSFSGTFADPGGTIVVFAQAQANWANGTAPGASTNTGSLSRPTNCGTPDVKIVKTANDSTLVPGQTFAYTLEVTNIGTATADNVVINDTIPSSLAIQSAPNCTVNGQAVSCTIGSLAVNASTTRTINVKVNADVCEAIDNTGTVSASNEPQDKLGNNSDGERVTSECSPDVDFHKDGPATVGLGNTVTYTITVHNGGTGASDPITVTDSVDSRWVGPVTASSTQGNCTVNGHDVSCAVGAIAAGGTVTVTISAKAPNESCPTIPNVAEVKQGNNNPQNTNGVETRVTGCTPNVTYSKSGPATVGQGQNVTYTISVHNGGSAESNPVTVTDTVDSRFPVTSAEASQGGNNACTVNGQAVSCSIGTLAAGATATVTIKATAPLGTCPTVPNVAHVKQGDGNPQDTNQVTTTVTGCVPQVTYAKDGTGTVAKGQMVTYHVTVHNGGSATSDPITVTDAVDSRYSGVTATASQGGANACTVNGNAVSCSLGTLAAGGNATVTITATAPSSTCPTIPNVAQVKQGSNAPQNTNEVTTTVTGCTPNITIHKSASQTRVSVGDNFTYTLVVQNTGDATATGVQLSDSIPAGLTIQDPLPAGCTAAGNDITCAIGDLASGVSASRTFTVKAGEGACPDVDNFGTVTVGGNSSNSNTVNVNVLCEEEGNIAVRIVKDNDADNDGRYTDSEESKKQGSDVPFKLVITNTGEDAWTFTSLVDSFANTGIDLLDAHCDQLAGVTLQPGESRTCRFTLRNYSPPELTSLINTAKVCVVGTDENADMTNCDKDPSKVRSAKVLGRTVTPPPTKTPPGGTAFTGSDSTVEFGLLAFALLLLGTGVMYAGYRRRASYDS